MSFEHVCVAGCWRNHGAISLPLSSLTNRPNWLFPRPLFLIGHSACVIGDHVGNQKWTVNGTLMSPYYLSLFRFWDSQTYLRLQFLERPLEAGSKKWELHAPHTLDGPVKNDKTWCHTSYFTSMANSTISKYFTVNEFSDNLLVENKFRLKFCLIINAPILCKSLQLAVQLHTSFIMLWYDVILWDNFVPWGSFNLCHHQESSNTFNFTLRRQKERKPLEELRPLKQISCTATHLA